MQKSGRRIPISRAKEIGVNRGYNQVLIIAFDGETGTTSVVTWGKSLNDCDEAAKDGNAIKKALAWPEELTNAKPARIRAKEKLKSKI